MPIRLITSSIAHSTKCRYLSYSEANLEVFCPAVATRCTDGVKFSVEEGTSRQNSSPSVQQ